MAVCAAAPRVVFSPWIRESRPGYLRRIHPHACFGTGCYADDQCAFEEGVRVCDNAAVFHSSIGMFSYLAPDSTVQHCTMGRYCSIGPGVMIGLGVHPIDGMISTYPAFYSVRKHAVNYRADPKVVEYKPIIIKNDVWIGARAVILDGVTIGDGAIIAAGSVVTKNVEPYTIVGGIPAKLIRRRFSEEDAQSLVAFAWWNRGAKFCRKHADLFADAPAFLAMVAVEKEREAAAADTKPPIPH